LIKPRKILLDLENEELGLMKTKKGRRLRNE